MRNRGFTLLEIVLAIGLSGAVITLLTMSIDLYLVRVDISRSRVETAQLARTILNQLSTDIRAARYLFAGSSEEEASDTEDATSATLGIFGTTTELRIDRTAAPGWEWITSQISEDRAASAITDEPIAQHMPQTVHYLLNDGKELLAADWAARGVSEEPTSLSYAGLYREQLATGAWLEQNASSDLTGTTTDSSMAELFAPEVVGIEFAYFDGEQLLTEWDSAIEESLPAAIEIKLTLLKVPFMQDSTDTISGRDELRRNKENLIEYRRFVRLMRSDGGESSSSAEEVEEGSPT